MARTAAQQQATTDMRDALNTRHEPVLSPLGINEVRYLSKAIRYRLGLRSTKPGGKNTSAIPIERVHELNAIADWIVWQ